MQNPFSWSYLTAPTYKTPVWGPLSIAFLVVSGILLVGSIYFYYDPFGFSKKTKPLRHVVEMVSSTVGILAVCGLFFFLLRALQVNVFSLEKRIWIYLVALGYIIAAGYLTYFLWVAYPPKRQAIEAYRLKQRYIAPAIAGGSGARGPRNSRSNSRKKSGKRK